MEYLVEKKIIPPLSNVLEESVDTRLVAAALEGLNNILSVGKDIQEENSLERNPYTVLFEEVRFPFVFTLNWY